MVQISKYLFFERALRCDASGAVSPAHPALVLPGWAAQLAVASDRATDTLHAHPTLTVVQIARGAINHLLQYKLIYFTLIKHVVIVLYHLCVSVVEPLPLRHAVELALPGGLQVGDPSVQAALEHLIVVAIQRRPYTVTKT